MKKGEKVERVEGVENGGISELLEFLGENRILYAATKGLDKLPKVHPIEFLFEQDGGLYFALPKCEAFYGELSLFPNVMLCAADGKSLKVLTLSGEAVFTEDEAIIKRCLEASAALQKRWGKDTKLLIAFFIRDAEAVFTSMLGDERAAISTGTPENALIGITLKKDTELRDRLIKLMERREAEPPETEGEAALFSQKLYDGALMYFAETAKALWPRMDIRPIERSALFETYDEREKFTALAKKLIGNASIEKPEDITHYLNKETLAELNKKASDIGK
ncbi:MAG: hypothetical protein II871_01785 [Clostridia bacterium]|nr:hypothetical protein [Clostridia bacterium]